MEYRIASDLRRCCWYVILAAPVMIAVFVLVSRFVAAPDHMEIDGGCLLLAIPAVLVAIFLRWRLRVDSNGVSRRLLFRWDAWPWSDFASGRVRKLHPCTLHDPARPWWRRKLRLGSMDSRDIQKVMSVINLHYRLPEPPAIPEQLTVKYGLRASARFDDGGIHVSVGKKQHEYAWDDVQFLQIDRMAPVRRDFARLVIVLPDQEIELAHAGESPTWQGASAEVVSECLLRHVAPERIDTLILGNEPTRRERIERMLAGARTSSRQLVWDATVILAIILALSRTPPFSRPSTLPPSTLPPFPHEMDRVELTRSSRRHAGPRRTAGRGGVAA